MSCSWKTRVLALLLVVVMAVSLLPVAAFAEEVTETESTGSASSGAEPAVAAVTYKVTYDKNAEKAAGTMKAQSLATGNLTANAFTYTSYVFTGWNTKADGTGTAYANQAKVTLTEDITLYAQWKKKETYTIKYSANATQTTGTVANQSVAAGELLVVEATVLPNAYAKADHTFKGWNTKSNGSGTSYAPGDTIKIEDDITLYAQWECDYYKTISHKTYELAPGVLEREVVLNNASGTHRQVSHVVEVDIHNEYTKVIPSYKGMIPTPGSYGVEIMSKQAAYAEANGYGNVVAAMNLSLSWYDSQYYLDNPHLVGEPLGYMILDGVQYTNSQGQTAGAQTCLVINFDEKDGVARPSDIPKTEIRSTSSKITGWEEQVIPANFGFLVKDGVNQYSDDHASDAASRSFVGIKADGTIVMVMNDGRQAPYSAGFNSWEMAEFMISLGCVQAINGDGGGSSAFLSQRPGEDLKINCKPSDGAERETTHGILVISTAPATGEFSRAVITSEEEYYTPNSSVQFAVEGTDLVGTPAEIPAEAVWQLADESFGTIENGLFVSNGKEGVVTVQMVYNGAVVGVDTISIVMPDTLNFAQENMVVPYNKTVNLGLTATYNYQNVVLKPADITFTLDNEAVGVINGFEITTAAEGIENPKAVLTAKIGEVSAVTNISLGKGSEIIYDFEDQYLEGWKIYTNYGKYGPIGPNGKVTDDDGNYWYHGQNERGYISVVDKSTGMVKNGDYALAVECDFSQLYETGYHALNLTFPQIDCTDSVAIGFWLYVPYDARHAEINYGAGNIGNGQLFEMCEGWHYVTATAKDNTFYYINISVDDRAAASDHNNYDYITEANIAGKYTFYIDDITVDYSTAVEDRENPVFSAPKVLSVTGETSAQMTGQTINYNTVTFEAAVAEDTEKTNATGLNAASAKAYVDGVSVDCTYTGGKITVPGVVLADGFHTVKFAISDNNGNSSWISGDIRVAAGSDASTVKVVPQDPTADRLLIGSVYWMDVVATDIETIDKVELTLDMNNGGQWELEGMTTAAGFSASYSIQKDDNIASITITRTGTNTATGEAVLASFPVRTWESTITQYEGYTDQTPAKLVSRGIIWKQAVEIELQRGMITFVEGKAPNTTGTFGMEDVLVDTEIFFTNYSRKSVAGAEAQIAEWKAAGTGWHEHTVVAAEDKEATCTEAGYTGRTYCESCDSFIAWGTTVPVSDHTYAVDEADGLMKCACGELLTGVQDGVEYVNGVAKDGWVGNSYYINGVKLTGVRKVMAPDNSGEFYYDFGTDGICPDQSKYVGVFYDVEGEVYRYAYLGKIATGWQLIDGEQYYFLEETQAAAVGEVPYLRVTYTFDETGRLTAGQWYDTGLGVRYYYGPDYYRGAWADIAGDKYYFDSVGHRYEGYHFVTGAIGNDPVWYEFGEDGKLIRELDYTGLMVTDFGTYYLKNGISQYGLFNVDGDYYYFRYASKEAIKGTSHTLQNNYGHPITIGTYEFDEDGKMIMKNGIVEENNGLFFYKDSLLSSGAGFIEYNGEYYYVRSNGQLATGEYDVSKTNGLTEEGPHMFDEDGKAYSGLIDGSYYEKGLVGSGGFVEVDGDYYYIRTTGELATGKYYVSKTNGLTEVGFHMFGADGKAYHGPVEENGGIYFYQKGLIAPVGFVEHDGAYYYARTNGQVATGQYYVGLSKTNGLTTEGFHMFDADGKAYDGLVAEEQGIFYYEKGLIAPIGFAQIDGDYYYVRTNGQVATGQYYVSRTNELTEIGFHMFAEDGKAYNGPVEENGAKYFYINGIKAQQGFLKYEGGCYYVRSNLQLATGKYYVGEAKTNGLTTAGYHWFDENGKGFNGICEIAEGKYYFENGLPAGKGIVEVDGDLYYANSSGKVITGRYYVGQSKTNGYVKEGFHYFDENGKLI